MGTPRREFGRRLVLYPPGKGEPLAGRYRIEGYGSDLRLVVEGDDEAACLAAAVRAFAEAVRGGALPAGTAAEIEPVEVSGEGPAELLVALVDELILLLDTEGRLACDLEVRRAGAGVLEGRLAVAPTAGLRLEGVTPKAATWHELRLEPGPRGWEGSVVLDL